jgi:hypothetical protein
MLDRAAFFYFLTMICIVSFFDIGKSITLTPTNAPTTTPTFSDEAYNVTFYATSYYVQMPEVVACSAHGDTIILGGYVGTADQTIWTSRDYGLSWTKHLGPGGPSTPGIGPYFYTNIAVNASGSFVALVGYAGANYFVSISHDYGSEWSTVINTSTLSITSIACSNSGEYVLLGQYSSLSHHSLVSVNYGINWTTISSFTAEDQSVAVSGTGQYMVTSGLSNNSYAAYVSCDYGSSWTRTDATACMTKLQVSDSGQFMTGVGCVLVNHIVVLFQSFNYGEFLSVLLMVASTVAAYERLMVVCRLKLDQRNYGWLAAELKSWIICDCYLAAH